VQQSTRIRANSVQIRSHCPRGALSYPIELDARFPLHATALYEQNDAPIRRLHVHPCLEMGVCFEGSGIFVVGDKVLPFGAGDAVFINHREPHLAQSAPGTRSRWAWMYLDPLHLFRAENVSAHTLDPSPFCGPQFPNVWTSALFPTLVESATKLHGELANQPPRYEEMCRALVWQLFVGLNRAFPHLTQNPPLTTRFGFERLAPALERLTGCPDTPASGAELARLCGLSEPGFRRLFRATMGRSPHDYALDWRVRMAASLLRSTPKSVLCISQEVGFASLSSFNRCFLKTFGMSPRAYRSE